MLLFQAAVLGIVQGLTEFLPVSSSGHLILVREILRWDLLADPHWNTVFDVAVHAGTFVGLVVYLWSDVERLFAAFIAGLLRGFAGDPYRRLALIIAVATIPAALAGLLAQDIIEAYLRQAPLVVAALLIVFGIALWVAERRGTKAHELTETEWLDGILVGVFQVLALAPGVSRSGITITAGLLRGMTRETAARFSFLLSVPIIGGAALYGLQSVVRDMGALPSGSIPTFAVGFLAAAVSGYLCIHYFLRYLQTRSFAPFILYRILVGALLIVVLATR